MPPKKRSSYAISSAKLGTFAKLVQHFLRWRRIFINRNFVLHGSSRKSPRSCAEEVSLGQILLYGTMSKWLSERLFFDIYKLIHTNWDLASGKASLVRFLLLRVSSVLSQEKFLKKASPLFHNLFHILPSQTVSPGEWHHWKNVQAKRFSAVTEWCHNRE